jgi:hypothetical protein
MLKAGKICEDSSRRWLVIVNLVLLRNRQALIVIRANINNNLGLSRTKSKQFDTI